MRVRWSSVAATYPTWFKDNLVKPLVQESNTGYPTLDKMGVPLARDFARTDEQKQILKLVLARQPLEKAGILGDHPVGPRAVIRLQIL